jgi:hypothetical protein
VLLSTTARHAHHLEALGLLGHHREVHVGWIGRFRQVCCFLLALGVPQKARIA